MKNLINALVKLCLSIIPLKIFVGIMRRCLLLKIEGQDPKVALSTLMELDNYLYTLTGRYAAPYNNGVHVKHRLTGYVDHFADLAKEMGGPFLDIGCGKGELAFAVASRTEEPVVGIDILEERIEATKRLQSLKNLEYKLGDATKVTLDQQFQTIILSNVFEHIADRHNFLVSIVDPHTRLENPLL